ncbi:unnamed protein product [Sphenostylis stenocarpa]|uniref:Uncharacterized protein n=1 Tax=Sphenostylis stenocarpa TaxID=92480 RepID=A0AA86T620_9FABA|nr:unnamed protein product [Sphenostylis stenocarpa]
MLSYPALKHWLKPSSFIYPESAFSCSRSTAQVQKKGLQFASQSGKSNGPNMRDLRERLSGTMTIKRPADAAPKKSRKAEEVYMTALNHRTDEDLKSMMGRPIVRIELVLEYCTFHKSFHCMLRELSHDRFKALFRNPAKVNEPVKTAISSKRKYA